MLHKHLSVLRMSAYWTMEIMTMLYIMAIIIYMGEITIDSDLLINVKV